jgi:Na+/proline symporter
MATTNKVNKVAKVNNVTKVNKDLRHIATIFMLISIILFGITIIGLLAWIWLFPMWNAYKSAENDNKSHVTLGVCSLFFASLVAGILMLCSGGTDK